MATTEKKPPTAKIFLTHGTGTDVLERLSKAYATNRRGKGVLIQDCVIAGYLLKECGILDIVSSADEYPEFRHGTSAEKREIMTKLLSGSLVGVSPAVMTPSSESTSTEGKVAKVEEKKEEPRKPFKGIKLGQ